MLRRSDKDATGISEVDAVVHVSNELVTKRATELDEIQRRLEEGEEEEESNWELNTLLEEPTVRAQGDKMAQDLKEMESIVLLLEKLKAE